MAARTDAAARRDATEHVVTYCDLAFLEAFFQNKPEDDGTGDLLLWYEIRTFLQQNARLHVSVPAGTPDDAIRQHPVLEQLLRNSGGGPQAHLDPESFEKIETADFHRERDTPHALFLVEDTEAEHDALSRRFGAFFLPFEALPAEWARIGRYQSLSISRAPGSSRRLNSWNDLEAFATPMTGLVVCDQFMLAGRTKARRNLYPMLLHLLPDGPNEIPVDVTLLARDDQLYGSLDQVHGELAAFLDEQRPDLDFNLCIVTPQGSNSYHDRHVFTNYGFLKSGQSFNYFDGQGEIGVDTTLDFEPLVSALAVAREKLDVVKNAMPPVARIGVTQVATGSLKNKLFADSA